MMRAVWAMGACIPLCLAQGITQINTVECVGAFPSAAENRTMEAVQYRITDPGQCAPPKPGGLPAGVVPARILSHKPPKAARTEFERATKAWDKDNKDEAIRHLMEAIRLDPSYIEARAQLGTVYADTGQVEQALAMFDEALALEPNWALIHIDRAAALVTLNRPEEAELAARRALRLYPSSIVASYMLGWAMLMQNHITSETAEYLALAAGKYPPARKALKAVRERLAEEHGR